MRATPQTIRLLYTIVYDGGRSKPRKFLGLRSLENVVTRLTRAKDMFTREGTGTYSFVDKKKKTLSKAGKLVERGSDSIAKARNRFSKTGKEDL